MFAKLKQRWGVNGLNLFLIICTFAFGGSFCGYLGRRLLVLLGIEKGIPWFVLYIVVITLLWPLCVLVISIPFGQFGFFKQYLLNVWAKIRGRSQKVTRVAIFASGAGSNAQKIIDHFRNNKEVQIGLIVCNKPDAGVVSIAHKEKIPCLLIQKKRFYEEDAYLPDIRQHHINFIVLAGFLLKIPASLIQEFPYRIVNIHPALLPKYGGKGMYGDKVHESVIAAREKESGITIHYVDEIYDHGKIIFQSRCAVEEKDTAESLAQKIHQLEHAHYPVIISQVVKATNNS